MKSEAPNQGSVGSGLNVQAMKCPTSLKAAAKQLSAAQKIIGSHQRTALKTALQCGAILHYVKSQVQHGAWAPWLKENFDGSADTAENYRRIAQAYSENPRNFADCTSIGAALQIAKVAAVSSTPPACLPGLMDPPKLRAVQNPPEAADEPQSAAADLSDADGEPDSERLTVEPADPPDEPMPRIYVSGSVEPTEDVVYMATIEVVQSAGRAIGQLQFSELPPAVREEVAQALREAHVAARRAVRLLHQAGHSQP